MVSLYSNRTVTKTEEKVRGHLRTFHYAGKTEKTKKAKVSKESLNVLLTVPSVRSWALPHTG